MLSGLFLFVMNSTPMRWALTGLALVVAWAGVVWRIRQGVRREVDAERMEDTHERTQAGRDAVGVGRDRGAPDERLRQNDRLW
jgi:hypothetical protein